MNLPELSAQVAYAHAAWGMVLAACGVALFVRWPRLAVGSVAAAWVSCALPGPVSPAYWLSLALWLPSALLVLLCARAVWVHGPLASDQRALPTGLAAVLAVAGALLYLDSAGWTNLGLYASGFARTGALAAMMLGLFAVVAAWRGAGRGAAFAVLLALMVFALLRLPTGNAWDALLDPMLWLWSLATLAARALRRLRAGSAQRSPPAF